jgi:NTP pyrophosphatase (non-canonical NTP hydrolase)
MNKALTFEDLRYANIQRNKEWDAGGALTGPVGALFRAVEAGGEFGEILNNVKKLVREELGIKGSRVSLDDLADELGDGQITLDLIAMHYSIDLGEAAKRVFNRKSEEFGFKTKLGEQLELFGFKECDDCLTDIVCKEKETCLMDGLRKNGTEDV